MTITGSQLDITTPPQKKNLRSIFAVSNFLVKKTKNQSPT